jgi:hypothetical protein
MHPSTESGHIHCSLRHSMVLPRVGTRRVSLFLLIRLGGGQKLACSHAKVVPKGELTGTLTVARVAHQTCCRGVCLQKTSSEHIWCWHWISKCIRRCHQCNQQKAGCMGPARWPHLIGGWLAPASVGSPINTEKNILRIVGTPSMLRGKHFGMYWCSISTSECWYSISVGAQLLL